MVKGKLLFAGLTALLAGSGCRHAPVTEATGRTAFTVIEPPPSLPPQMTATEATEPTNRANYRPAAVEKLPVMPVYPSRALKAKAGAATVGVHVVVDATGHVADIRPSLLAITIAPPGFAAEFTEAVETALRRWKFSPARVEYVETVTEKGFTYDRVTRTETVEAEFDLSFTFTPDGRVEPAR